MNIPDFMDLTKDEHNALEVPPPPTTPTLADAIEAVSDEEQISTHDARQVVGLSLRHCVADLLQHPELLPYVRKIICDEADLPLPGPMIELAQELKDAGKLYWPQREGRQHQLPMGNPMPRQCELPSRWWITNLDYRKVLTGKLRAIAQALRERDCGE